MNRLVAYKYRLYPNKTQQTLLNKTMGCVRFFYNQQVATFRTYDKETNPMPYFKTSTELRNEIEWMKEGRRSLGDITDAEAEVAKPEKRLELSVINGH